MNRNVSSITAIDYSNYNGKFARGNKFFELSNHIGNVLVTVSDKKLQHTTNNSTVDYYNADVVTANDYYPFGSQMPGRKYSAGNSSYRYGFNGQEKSNDVTEGNCTALYWEYDSRTGRRWNLDPKPNKSVSPYATFYNNPIWFSDRLGDSSVWNNRGYVVHYDAKDKDLRAFMLQDGKLTLLGELGNSKKPIDASVWFSNLLKDNSESADNLWDPALFGDNFKTRVQQDGIWDYKYRSSSNENSETQKQPYHILGIAFQRKDTDSKRGAGDLSETLFTFNGGTGRAEDLNNFHFGVVGKAYGLFTEEFMLKTAGGIEMGKWRDDYKQGKRPSPKVPASWRPIQGYHRPPAETEPILGWPYGDNPEDSKWIIRGFRYHDANKKN